MNIREHIEAGHYRTDGRGRSVVETQAGRVAIICAFDKPGFPLVGWLDGEHAVHVWTESGNHAGRFPETGLMPELRLLPPPPRKKVRFLGVYPNTPAGYTTEEELREKMRGYERWVVARVEYEEPWS